LSSIEFLRAGSRRRDRLDLRETEEPDLQDRRGAGDLDSCRLQVCAQLILPRCIGDSFCAPMSRSRRLPGLRWREQDSPPWTSATRRTSAKG